MKYVPEKAEENSRLLLKEYPDQIDGLQHSAEVCTAQGKMDTAIEYHDKTIECMKTHEGFDSESIACRQKKRKSYLLDNLV